MNVQEIASAVREHRCVVFAGSGLSRNAGLPDWLGLASELHRELVDAGSLSSEASRRIAPFLKSSAHTSTGIGLLVNEVGRQTVTRVLRKILQPRNDTPVFNLLKEIRFKGIVTTNYDRLLDNVCTINHYRLGNSLSDLRKIPTAVAYDGDFLLKIHGDLENELDPASLSAASGEAFMVLTQSDFVALVQGQRGEALRMALHSILQSCSILFIGYGFTDPDISWILRYLTQNFQFLHESWYLTKKASKYPELPTGVKLAPDLENWEGLPDWLANLKELGRKTKRAIATVVPSEPTEENRRAFLALARFLRELATENVAERVLAAAVIDDLSREDGVSVEWLSGRVHALLGVGPVLAGALTGATASFLTTIGVLRSKTDGLFAVNRAAAERLTQRAQRDWETDRGKFYESVRLRARPALSGLSSEFTERFDRVLQDLCINFGDGMAQWVYSGVGRELGWQHAKSLVAQTLKAGEDRRVAEAVLDLLFTDPSEDEYPYLYRLLGSAFLANSVRINPDVRAEIRAALASYELYLDSNILLPLIIREHPDHAAIQAVVAETRRVGVRVCVLRGMFEEVVSHRAVAIRSAESCQGRIPELLAITTAEGDRANCFLKGYLDSLSRAELQAGRVSRGSDLASWRKYIQMYTYEQLSQALSDFGISMTDPNLEPELEDQYPQLLDAIDSEWKSRSYGAERPIVLNEHEAEQFLYIYQRRKNLAREGRAPEAWFLSYETTLAKVFERQAGTWGIPPTFRFSAWAAFLDSRLPDGSGDPGAIVRVILKGHSSALELPDLASIVRSRIVGRTVTSRDEEAALQQVLSGYGLVTSLESCIRAVRRRGEAVRVPASELVGLQETVATEVESELASRVRELSERLEGLRAEVQAAVEETSRLGTPPSPGAAPRPGGLTPRTNRRQSGRNPPR